MGVHLKAVFTPLKIGQMEISCFRYIWKEIIFLEGLVKLKEIRNVEDLVKF